jgi:hypothetical protein
MPLKDEIDRLVRSADPPPTRTTAEEKPAPPSASSWTALERFSLERTRRGRVERSRKMYDEDGRYEGIVSTLARDATKGGFKLEFAEGQENPEALEIAESLRKRLGLDKRVDDWARLSFRDGESFLEVVISADREIVEVSRKPTLNMFRNSNGTDRFADPRQAYWYSDRSFLLTPGKDALWFADWQIVHVRWGHDEGSRYGRPLMASGHKAWKYFTQGEEDIVKRRMVRAGMRYLHVVEGSEPDIEAYRERNKMALNPSSALSDFFTNKMGSIAPIQGDANLGMIDDIVHHIDTWWIGSPVPKALLGYGSDLNRDVLQEQKEQYDETLGSVQEWVGDQMVKPLLYLEWLLHGIVPEMLEYALAWQSKAVITPEDILKIAQAGQVLRGLNIPEAVIAQVMARFLPGIDAEMLMNLEPQDSGRLAAIAAQLGNLLGQGDDDDGE